MTDGERRRQLRVEDASVIRYRVAAVGDPGPYRFRAAVTGNLSSGGVLLRTFVAHEPGTVLDLEILLHKFDEIAKTGDLVCTLDNEQLVEEIEPYVRKVADIGALGRLYIQRELINRKIGRNESKVFSEKMLELLQS